MREALVYSDIEQVRYAVQFQVSVYQHCHHWDRYYG